MVSSIHRLECMRPTVADPDCLLAALLGAPKLEEVKFDLSLALAEEVRVEVEGRVAAAVAGLLESVRRRLKIKRTWMF